MVLIMTPVLTFIKEPIFVHGQMILINTSKTFSWYITLEEWVHQGEESGHL